MLGGEKMLDIQYTKQGLKDLKYVIIKMATEPGQAEGIKGLLLGYGPLISDDKKHKEDMFLWLYKDECAYLFNLDHYEIRMIEVALNKAGRTAEIKIYNDTLQNEALRRIITLKEALRDQSRIQNNGLIDISTYEAVPLSMNSAVKGAVNGKDADTELTEDKSWDSRNKTKWDSKNKTDSPYVSPYTYTPKEVETTYIKRTTRYSITEALTQMKEKIKKIRKGTYSPPKLRKRSVAKEEEKQANNSDPSDPNDIGFVPYG